MKKSTLYQTEISKFLKEISRTFVDIIFADHSYFLSSKFFSYQIKKIKNLIIYMINVKTGTNSNGQKTCDNHAIKKTVEVFMKNI